MKSQEYYAWETAAFVMPIYVLNGMSSRPLATDTPDWFCWREVLPPRIAKSTKKGVPDRRELELGEQYHDYASKVVMRSITQDEAFTLAIERRDAMSF